MYAEWIEKGTGIIVICKREFPGTVPKK